MKCHVVFAVFCAIVSLYVVFYCSLDTVLHFIQEENYKRMEQYFSFHKEDRKEIINTKKRTKTSENEQGIQLSKMLQEATNKMMIRGRPGTKQPQKSAQRTNLII